MKNYTNQLESFKKERYTHLFYTIFSVVGSCQVTYAFQSEFTLYSCLNVKELLARRRSQVWSLNDCNWTPTQNHWIRKRTLNHLAKLTYELSGSELSGSVFESSCSHYIYGADIQLLLYNREANLIKELTFNYVLLIFSVYTIGLFLWKIKRMLNLQNLYKKF